MTLKDCPECSQQASSEADRCPHCGYPVNPAKSDLSKFRISVMKRAYTTLTIIMFAFLLVFAFTNDIEWVFAAIICLLGALVSSVKIYIIKKHGNNINN